jgi:LysR family transcriptional regulator, glycine cleavage system transcriptional activator
MAKLLPPLNALRAFEATARHQSFSRAADELNVTPAALSHQVAGLESFLGERLFNRNTRSISLTPAGEVLYPGLNAAFLQIRQSVERLLDTFDGQVLVVSAPPGFTAKWLAPRLHHFLSSQPDLDVRISATQSFANFVGDGVDVAIRNTAGPFPGLWARKFLAIETLPVVAPRLIDQFGPLNSPADLVRFPIIHDDSLGRMFGLPTWVDWLNAAGAGDLDLGRGLHFSSADHAIEAALEGAGVLLAPKALALDDVRLGRLVMPFALTIASNRAFHVVCPEGHEIRPKIAAFCAWVLDEAAKQGLACTDGADVAATPAHGAIGSRKRATVPESDPTPSAPAKAVPRPRPGRAPRASR